MNLGKSFAVTGALAGAGLVVTLALRGCDRPSPQAPSTQPAPPQATQFPPPRSQTEPVDPNDLFKDKNDSRVHFAPREPELAFVEFSKDLPTSGTWRGYPLLQDFNGDGRADLVAANREEDGYSVWMSNPKGPWVRCIDGPKKDVGGLPRDMAYGPARAADIDGDGRLDLLLSAHSDALRLYRNVLAEDKDGKPVDDGLLHWLRTESPIENPFLMLDIATGNLDGDGHPDVVGIGHFKGGFGVYLGDGKGGMRRLPESAQIIDGRTFGQRIELADIDGDGLDDIVSATNKGLKVFLTRTGTPFHWDDQSAGLPNPKIGNSITGLAVGRFREQAHPEIAACLVPDPMQPTENTDSIGVFAWNAETKTWEHADHGLRRNETYRELASGDLNGDGHLDLIAMSLESGGVIYLGDGKGNFTPKGRLPGIFGVGRITIGDIDGDQLADIVISIPATKERPEAGGLRALLNRRDLWK